MNEPAEMLWRRTVAAYAVPGVAPLCLRLQDQGDVDVMLLLCLCYAASVLKAPLSADEVEALRAVVEPWRVGAVRPVRTLRVALRASVDGVPEAAREAFRDRLKALELAAEKVQADLVADWLAARPAAGVPADPYRGLRSFLGPTPITDAETALLIAAFDV